MAWRKERILLAAAGLLLAGGAAGALLNDRLGHEHAETGLDGTRVVLQAFVYELTQTAEAFTIPSATFTSFPTETPNLTPTPDPESTSTQVAILTQPSTTPTRTPTQTVTPEFSGIALTPSATVTPENGSLSSYHILPNVQTGAHINNAGVTSIDNDAFNEYFGSALNADGKDTIGNIADFAANMLGEDVVGPISLDRLPNWWISRAEGLGWTSEDPIHMNLDALRNKFFSGIDRTGIFSLRDGIYRFGVITEARNFEQAVALAVIFRYIEGAGKIGLSQEAVQAFLQDPKIDAEIQATYSVLLSQSGYQSRTPEQGEIIQPWPGAWPILQESYNLVSDNGDVCETVMGPANDRDSQREHVVTTEYRVQTEARTPGNDETITRADSDGHIFVAVTFDNNAPASSGGAYSPTDLGIMRIDIFSARTFESVMNPDGTNPLPDDAGANWVETSFNRWVACGTGRGEVPTVVHLGAPQPGQPGQPENPTNVPPSRETPQRPTETPPTEETKVWATPVPTNEHGGNENPIPTPTESYTYPTEPAPTVEPTRPAY